MGAGSAGALNLPTPTGFQGRSRENTTHSLVGCQRIMAFLGLCSGYDLI